jgi:teichuronic acid biosynthesis protein TuaE
MQIIHSVQTKQTTKYAKISYLLFFIFAFWGPALGGVPLGAVSLFPARIFALTSWVLVIAALLFKRPAFPVPDRNFLLKYWRQIFLGAWLVWAVFSLIWTVDRGQGVRDIFNLFVGLSLAGMAPLFLIDRAQLNRAARIWLIILGVFLGMAFFEHFTAWHLPISRFSQGLQPHLAYRPTAVFVNENNFAVFISLSIPFLLARWRYFPAIKARILSGLGLFAAIYLLFVTGSRINFLVLFFSVLIYSLLLTPRGKRMKTLAALALLVAGIWLLFGLTQPAIRGYVLKQFGKIINPGQYFIGGGSLAVRINMVRNGIVFLLRTWGRGVGAGNFEAWIETAASYDTGEILNPHNWWIELAAEYGVLVALGYLAFFASLLLAAWKGWKQTLGEERWLPEALSLALAVFPLVAISPNSLLDFLPHWLILALALAWQQNFYKVGGER